MDHIRDHSPNHRHVTVTDLQVRVVRIVGGQCQSVIYFWQSLHRHLAVDRSDHHLANLWLNAFVYHQDVAISYVWFHWLTWDTGRRRWWSRWSLAVHWDQSSRPIRRTEAKDCACAEALIVEVEGAVCSCGDLLKLQGWRLLKRWTPRQRKH